MGVEKRRCSSPYVVTWRKKFYFFSSLTNLNKGPSDIREPQHECMIEMKNTQEAMKLY